MQVAKEKKVQNDEEKAAEKQPKKSGKGSKKKQKSTAVPETQPVVITATNLTDYVGQPKFTSDRFYDVTPPGPACRHFHCFCQKPNLSSPCRCCHGSGLDSDGWCDALH